MDANLNTTPQVVYSQRLDDLSAGEIIALALDGQEVTNRWDTFADWNPASPYISTLDVQTSAVLAASPTDTVGVKTVVPSGIDSVHPYAHHGLMTRSMVWKVDQNYPGPMYINWVASARTDPGPNGAILDGLPNYARLESPYGRFHIERLGNPNVSGSSTRNVQALSTTTAQVASIPAPEWSGGLKAKKIVNVFSLPVTLSAGDTIQAAGELRLNNPNAANTDLYTSLSLRGPASGHSIGPSKPLSEDSHETLASITAGSAGAEQDRYHIVSHAGSYTVPAGSPTQTYTLVIDASEDTTDGFPRANFALSNGGGQISALVFRSGTPTIPLHNSPASAGAASPLLVPTLDGDDFVTGTIAGRGTTSDGKPYVRVTSGAISTTPVDLGSETARVVAIEAMPESGPSTAPGYCADTPYYPVASSGEGAPYMRVSFGNQVVGEQVVRWGGDSNHYMFSDIPARLTGTGALKVEITNPYSGRGCTRGLRIRQVQLLGAGSPTYLPVTAATSYATGSAVPPGSVTPIAVSVPGSAASPTEFARVTIPHLDANDVIDATLSIQAQNFAGNPIVDFGTEIRLLDSAGNALATLSAAEPGENVLAGPWDSFQSRRAVWAAPATFPYSGPVTVQARAWAGAGSASGNAGVGTRRLSVLQYAR